ncbi:MAG TPA: three-Cys-motif partner protein TcmP [Pirellulaceae bacterium]|nr:three-Cys-motif partner protein TcmP [Pirellulaceae bacterium]HMO94448.1 three-Cys-motif partner protein TcmP [Pirellulaceae bacterium]HMP71613.1 three-Cys-motif partner protein TcmP [Pirellulaceae bacterium]
MAKNKSTVDNSPNYWKEYSNLQRIKHELIRTYLNGWFPKLVLGGSGRILFIDTHAGRGRHMKGELGSPLVALKSLMVHSFRDKILARGKVVFNFIERDEDNLTALKQEMVAFHPLPDGVHVHPLDGDSFEIIDDIISHLENEGHELAPSFVFCDPYGFSIPGSLLRRLMQFRGVELFINVIWRELDMAMAMGRNGTITLGMKARLDSVFDGHDWINAVDADDLDDRAHQCVNLFQGMVGANWATYIRMVDNNRTRYFLLHLTNHPAGRDLMKECIWSACPDGGYYASKGDDPRQQLLINPEPDLGPLEDWIRLQLHQGPKRWQQLHDLVREELWLKKHVNEVVRRLRKNDEIFADQYKGRCTPSNNPRLRLAK